MGCVGAGKEGMRRVRRLCSALSEAAVLQVMRAPRQCPDIGAGPKCCTPVQEGNRRISLEALHTSTRGVGPSVWARRRVNEVVRGRREDEKEGIRLKVRLKLGDATRLGRFDREDGENV